MRCVLEFDDLHPNPEVDCLSVAENLLDRNESLILNFFVPTCYKGQPLSLNKEWCNRLKYLVDSKRVSLGVHGHLHSTLEFKDISWRAATHSILASESILNFADISYLKAFRGPYWGINEATCDALVDLGYTHLYSHKDYKELNDKYSDKLKIVYYSWNLKDEYGVFENEPGEIIVGHGHTSPHAHLNCGNGLGDVAKKIETFLDKYKPECLRLDQI